MDPVHFTGREVLDMAVRIEENGLKFYNDACKASTSEAIKQLFKVLAEEEGHHVKVFLDLKKGLGESGAPEGFDPYAEEATQYLKALADTEVFTTPSGGGRLAGNMHNENEVLEVAIGMEKDSLLFYYEMQRMIREQDRHVLESLIEQEKEHLQKLYNLQKILAA
jgi:rubrerythrin